MPGLCERAADQGRRLPLSRPGPLGRPVARVPGRGLVGVRSTCIIEDVPRESSRRFRAGAAAGGRRRVYWHCRACDSYLPRQQEVCSCGARKERRRRVVASRLPPAARQLLAALLLALGAVVIYHLAR